jgi:hypothetical protein
LLSGIGSGLIAPAYDWKALKTSNSNNWVVKVVRWMAFLVNGYAELLASFHI